MLTSPGARASTFAFGLAFGLASIFAFGCDTQDVPVHDELLFPPAAPTGAQPKRNAGLIYLMVPVKGPGPAGRVIHSLSLRRYLVDGKPQWWLDAPHMLANDDVSEDLFQHLLAARVERRRPGARRDPQRYGLSDDRYSAQVVLQPGNHTVRLGDDAQGHLGDLIYAVRDQEPDVLLVPRLLRDLLNHDRDHFSSWSLTGQPMSATPRRLDLGTVVLEQRPSSWLLSQAASAVHPARHSRARTDSVNQVLSTLRSARARRLLPGSGLRYPPDFPDLKSPIMFDSNVIAAPMVIQANGHDLLYTGVPCPHVAGETYVVRIDSARLCFAAADVDKISPTYEALRELHLSPYEPGQVQRLTVNGRERAVQDPAVQLFLGKLRQASGQVLTAEKLKEAAPPKGTKPSTIELFAAEGDSAVLKIYDVGQAGHGGDGAYVQRDDEEPLSVTAEIAQRVRQGP